MAVSQKQCDDYRQWFDGKVIDLQKCIDKLKKNQSKIDPDLNSILNFENQFQVDAYKIYKSKQVKLKLMSSIVKIVSILNASAGFFATIINIFAGGG